MVIEARGALIATAIATAGAALPAHADTVVLANGDRLSGTILRKGPKTLVLKTDYARELRLDWSAVSTFATDASVTVMRDDESLVTGRAIAAGPGFVVIRPAAGPDLAPLALARVAYLNPPPEVTGIGERLRGHLNGGAAFTRGNTRTDSLHVDGEFVARLGRNRYTAGGNADRATDQGVVTSSSSYAYLKYDRFFSRRVYGYGSATETRDRFKDIRVRYTLGAGIGYQALEGNDTNLSIEAGANYVKTDNIDAPDVDYPALRWALKFDHRLAGGSVQVFHNHEWLAGVGSTRRNILRTQTGLRQSLAGGLAASLQYTTEYDSQPADAKLRLDRSVLIGLGYQW